MTAIADVFVRVRADTDGIAGEIEQGAAKDVEKAGRTLSQRFGGAFKNPTVLNALGAAAGTIIGTAAGRAVGSILNGSASDSLGRFATSLGSVGGGLAAIGVGAGGLAVAAQAADGLAGASDLLSTATSGLSAAKAFLTTTTNAETGAVTASGLSHARAAVQAMAHRAAEVAAAAATRVMAAGQWLLNAALTANPIGLVVVGIAALVAGFILAYKHSKTFRDIVGKVFDVLKKFVSFTPLGLLITQFDHVKGAVSWLLDKLGSLASKIKNLPGASILGKIPGFARGGVLKPGLSLVGEHGPELIASAKGGQRVYTNAQSKKMAATGGMPWQAAQILAAWNKLDRLDSQDRGHTPWMAINPNAKLDTSQIIDNRNKRRPVGDPKRKDTADEGYGVRTTVHMPVTVYGNDNIIGSALRRARRDLAFHLATG